VLGKRVSRMASTHVDHGAFFFFWGGGGLLVVMKAETT